MVLRVQENGYVAYEAASLEKLQEITMTAGQQFQSLL